MSDNRQKVKDMIRKALDENTPEKERIVTAFKALQFIEKHQMLDSPLEGLLDEDTKETIAAGQQFFQGAKKVFDKIQGQRGRKRGE